MKKTWRYYVESILLTCLAGLGIVISILDYFDWFGNDAWISVERVPNLILLLLGAVALYIVVERRNFMEENFATTVEKLSKIETKQNSIPQEIIKALDGVEVQTFATPFDLLEYATKRVREIVVNADQWIDDTSWGVELGHEAQLPKNTRISKEHRQQMRMFSKEHTHREIFMFNRPHQRESLKVRLENKDLCGYSCAYYEDTSNMLLLKFMIINDDEVILLADTFDGNMSIKHPEIVKMFKIYYQHLWDQATIIKDANGVRQDVVDHLIKEFRKQEPSFQIDLP